MERSWEENDSGLRLVIRTDHRSGSRLKMGSSVQTVNECLMSIPHQGPPHPKVQCVFSEARMCWIGSRVPMVRAMDRIMVRIGRLGAEEWTPQLASK